MTSEKAREQLIEKLRYLSVVEGPISNGSEVSYDLRIEGSDLDALLSWVQEAYGVDFSELKARDFNLNEPPAMFRSWFGKRRFKSMTVGALLEAIESKRWVTK